MSWKNIIKTGWIASAFEDAIHFDTYKMGFEQILSDGNIFTDDSLYTLLRRNDETLKELRLINIVGNEVGSMHSSGENILGGNKSRESNLQNEAI